MKAIKAATLNILVLVFVLIVSVATIIWYGVTYPVQRYFTHKD